MSKSAWDYTLEILSLMGDIDYYNDLLSKNLNKKEREVYSKKVDTLESKFFSLKEKLKKYPDDVRPYAINFLMKKRSNKS